MTDIKKAAAEINEILARKLMNATEMKKVLQEYAKTLDNKDKDESYGTRRDSWNAEWPGFLQWYNSHHNKVVAKLARSSK